jgi:hypothetical protein
MGKKIISNVEKVLETMSKKGQVKNVSLEETTIINNNASQEMIDESRNYLKHFKQRYNEYNDYVKDCC